MTIQPISAASVALYLTPADLQARGVCPEQLDLERTLEIAQEAFHQAGLSLEGALEIEAYPEKCGVLVFARVRPVDALMCSFEDWEDLFAAVACLDDPLPDGALYSWQARCWLLLPGSAGAAAARLSEFGRLETGTPCLEARLREYGTVLLERDAPALLRAHFVPRRDTST